MPNTASRWTDLRFRMLTISTRQRAALLGSVCSLIVGLAGPLRADEQHKPALDTIAMLPIAAIASVFHIEKSENRNQVHYAVHVDEACRPIGQQPIYGYWRELERGPNVVSPLLELERPAYGLAEPRHIERRASGGQVQLSLRALPERPVLVELFQTGASCGARALVAIQKQAAMLTSVYVDVGLLFSVNHVIVRGLRLADGAPIEEKLQQSR
jgi:hypothetical protein